MLGKDLLYQSVFNKLACPRDRGITDHLCRTEGRDGISGLGYQDQAVMSRELFFYRQPVCLHYQGSCLCDQGVITKFCVNFSQNSTQFLCLTDSTRYVYAKDQVFWKLMIISSTVHNISNLDPNAILKEYPKLLRKLRYSEAFCRNQNLQKC